MSLNTSGARNPIGSDRPRGANRNAYPNEAKFMTQGQEHLKKAQAHVAKFEAEREPERLREAYMALENVSLVEERDPPTRDQLRMDCLSS